jgi:hypothetical protein
MSETIYQPCFVCSAPVQLSEPDPKFDGTVKELDENSHAFCARCREAIRDAFGIIIQWSSSEDHDLMVDNAAAEGLRVGRLILAEPAQLLTDRSPLHSSMECRYCDLDLSGRDELDPNEHKDTCEWARLVRALRGLPLNGGVQP